MSIEDRLRTAIASGDFTEALELLPGYTASVSNLEAFRRFHDWARATTLCARSHDAARLEQAARLDAYRPGAPKRVTWETRG